MTGKRRIIKRVTIAEKTIGTPTENCINSRKYHIESGNPENKAEISSDCGRKSSITAGTNSVVM